MEEKDIKKRLIRISVITIVGSLILTLLGIGIWIYIKNTAYISEQQQMRAETNEYCDRISKQLDKNMQILTTLAKAYEVGTITEHPDKLEKSLIATNSANDFVSMVYMRKDGTGILNTVGYGTWDNFTLSDCHPMSAEAINSALKGKNSISKMFDSEVHDEKLFVYAVPVYHNGELSGALAASDTIDIFTDIANGQTVMEGSGYVHLISSDGTFLVRSKHSPILKTEDNIYNENVLDEKTKDKVAAALENGKNVAGEYSYNGYHYHFYMQPLGLNGWYLFCANMVWGSSFFAGNVLKTFGLIVLLLVALVNILLFTGRRLFKKYTKTLIKTAYTDPVTGAENTMRFDQKMTQILTEKKQFSTAALNIHNFKGINDLFGKERGNMVLRYLKTVIENHLEPGEFFCRDTADLFYILLLDTEKTHIEKRLKEIINLVSKTAISYNDYSYDLSLYAGVAVNGDREKALVAVQSILYRHLTDIAFYNNEMHDAVRKKNFIESQMELALQNQEFKLFLQPKFEMKTNRLIGAEALVRWQNPDGSYKYPGDFIPLFEKNGFCLKLDMYMIELAFRQIKEWENAGIAPIPISVNQSKLLFSDLNYPDNLTKILQKHKVSPSMITLEVLEGIASDNLEFLNHQIDELHKRGFRISMDDFGSGYSSLNMLYLLKIDELKLDKGFLKKISKEGAERRQIILEQIIGFARKLGISTVAEGVETEEDKELIINLKCDIGQGYLFDKPIPAEDFSQKYMKIQG
jgi:diguanylate cyclase (GGDEF)-like protein